MGDNHAGSDDDLDMLFDRVSNKLGWKSDANFDQLFEQLSQSTKKKKSKRPITSGKKKKKTATKKKSQDLLNKQGQPFGTPPSSSRNQSTRNVQNSRSLKAGIRNEISRSLELEFKAGKSNSLNISVVKKVESETAEALRDAVVNISPNGKRDCVSPNCTHDDACRTLCKFNDFYSANKPECLDVQTEGSNRHTCRPEKPRQSNKDVDLENKENIQNLHEANIISERTLCSDEDVKPSGTKLDGRSPDECLAEDDTSHILTKDFTESPQPMRWLMSPPASRPDPAKMPTWRTLSSDNSDDDSNTDENDVDIIGANVPSLAERLAQNHLENKRKEAARKKNRRRSCANPRSAPFVVDHEWAEDQRISGQDDEDGKPGLEAVEDDVKEERGKIDRGEVNEVNHDAVLQRKDEPELDNTNAESFQKARTRYQDSSSDDDFEAFLNAVKTPLRSKVDQSDSFEAVYVVDDDDDFINDAPLESKSDDDDDIFYLKVNNLENPLTNGKKRTKKHPTVGSRSGSILSQILSSSDDDEDVFVIPDHTPSIKKQISKATASTTSSKKTPSKPRRPLQPTSLSTNRCFSTPSRSERPAPRVSFLASLSTPGKGMSTRSRYVSDFKRNKDELTQKLFKLYNDSVFENKLPSDFSITWNTRMRKTAGFCFYKKKLGDIRTARIELSVKVCDTAERLRDTLVHELCHAASWLIHGVSDGHGKFWKYWAAKANLAHPEIPIIKRCHTYEINTKFKYKCVQCGNIIGRHSKSLDTKRFCCAYCNGRLELQPTLRKDGTPARARGPNPFAAFVKENYGSVKKTHGAAKHAEVMKLLSQEFASKTKIMDT